MIGSKTLPRSVELAARRFLCSASLISIGWSQSPQVPHVVVGKVQISAVVEPLKLAEPNQISIQTGGQKVTSVVVSWNYYFGNIPHPAVDEDSVLPVSYDSSGDAFVRTMPLRLGKAQLSLLVFLANGEFERKTIDVQVVQPERQPERLVIASGGNYRVDHPVISLDLSDRARKRDVDPAAIYKDVISPIPLRASEVSFRMINSTGNEAAAEIDPSTGIVTARHVGQALLETSFAGVSTLTCIDVMNDVRLGPGSRCKELLPPGKRLPPSPMELDPRPAPQVRAPVR